MTHSMSTIALPSVTVGVVTHDRAKAFGKLLEHMRPVVASFNGRCEIVVANNSGTQARDKIEQIVTDSGIKEDCQCTVYDSPENNIAIGRNLVFDNAQGELIAFIDDDEYPSEIWLESLVRAMNELQADIVAGPIVAVFEQSVKRWIQQVDVHNINGLTTGDTVQFAASGNFLIKRNALEDYRFNPEYGKSGGEDTEFFLRLCDAGCSMKWCKEAIVYEDIPLKKSSTGFMLRRFMTQGATYRSILSSRGDIRSQPLFVVRAVVLTILSLPIGAILLVIGHSQAGNWIKRAFSNLGKYYSPGKQLYG